MLRQGRNRVETFSMIYKSSSIGRRQLHSSQCIFHHQAEAGAAPLRQPAKAMSGIDAKAMKYIIDELSRASSLTCSQSYENVIETTFWL